mmetsp:Transcript_3094/g.9448  ORF Transcript_3094/g.9448 Transcript_3094/m.9448 type:complete len:211 (+) Transcript_3094:855-1487(+)
MPAATETVLVFVLTFRARSTQPGSGGTLNGSENRSSAEASLATRPARSVAKSRGVRSTSTCTFASSNGVRAHRSATVRKYARRALVRFSSLHVSRGVVALGSTRVATRSEFEPCCRMGVVVVEGVASASNAAAAPSDSSDVSDDSLSFTSSREDDAKSAHSVRSRTTRRLRVFFFFLKRARADDTSSAEFGDASSSSSSSSSSSGPASSS